MARAKRKVVRSGKGKLPIMPFLSAEKAIQVPRMPISGTLMLSNQIHVVARPRCAQKTAPAEEPVRIRREDGGGDDCLDRVYEIPA
jgi:hypothetical protein